MATKCPVSISIRANWNCCVEGQAPIVETGIQELTRAVMRGGSVNVTDSVRDAILATDMSFVCVGTPARQNGNQDLAAISRIAEQIGAILPEKSTRHVIVIRSTVKPGTLDEVIKPAIEAASGLARGARFQPVLPAGVPARRHVDQRLRQSAVDGRRRRR